MRIKVAQHYEYDFDPDIARWYEADRECSRPIEIDIPMEVLDEWRYIRERLKEIEAEIAERAKLAELAKKYHI